MDSVQEKDMKTNGRWTKIEHQKFMLGLELYGKNWKKIEQLVGTRTGSQIRSHAQKFFLKSNKLIQMVESAQAQSQQGQLQPASSVISNMDQNNQEHLKQYSYFMQKMYNISNYHRIQMTNIHENINFWDSFIDIKCSKIENNDVENKRKDSFLVYDESKFDTSFTHYNTNLLGDQII